ncbi:MAG: hypothetical protein JO142_08035 [Burkholderiales bacterium]|nr:hypothetical protein [Burkholderiales bacterium]
MNAAQIVQYAARYRVGLMVDGDRLKVTGDRVAVNELFIADLRKHRDEVIRLLQAGSDSGKPVSITAAIVPFRLGDSANAGGVLIDPDGLVSAVRSLWETYGRRLDLADLLELVDERAAIAEIDGEQPADVAASIALRQVRQYIVDHSGTSRASDKDASVNLNSAVRERAFS